MPKLVTYGMEPGSFWLVIFNLSITVILITANYIGLGPPNLVRTIGLLLD
jgi:hypothetical protein